MRDILDTVVRNLTPFETENVVAFLKNLSFKSAMENPWTMVGLLLVVLYAVVKRSKFVLLTLFSFISIAFLLRITMPAEGDQMTMASTLPFAFGALLIGAIIIYFTFIKSE